MSQRRKLLMRLLTNVRVDFTSGRFLSAAKFILLGSWLLIHLLLLLAFVSDDLSYTKAAILLIASAFTTLTIIYLYTHLRSASIIGDSLLLTSINNSNKITSILSIKHIKTFVFPGVQLTRLSFSLDGYSRRVLLLTSSKRLPSTPEKTMKKAIKICLKEKGKS